MAVPKRKKSKMRIRQRKAHIKAGSRSGAGLPELRRRAADAPCVHVVRHVQRAQGPDGRGVSRRRFGLTSEHCRGFPPPAETLCVIGQRTKD